MRHKKTGARVFVLENDDNNKVFNIAFRTVPTDSTGVAHIIEHSVLCGSEKYPVKDPFVELAKGSLIILALTVIQTAKIFVQGIMSGNLGDYLILALLIPLTVFAIRTGLRGNQSYIDKYNEHVRQYNEPYLQKMIQLQEDGAKQDKALKELTNGWFPSAYLSPNVVLTFIDYMKKKRATTMKELANLYEMDKLYAHQMQMTQEIIDSNRSIDNQLRFSNMIGMYQIIQMDNIKDFVRRYW
mgnify:CR=1 FL=1